ncbi:GEVED domain-containing protein [Flavobacteriaceae bacterium]|nr:GEVED domain-containing protein [Flavobacteriaceae bacterium]
MLKNYFILFILISYVTSFSQTIVSTDSQNKKVIIEEFTGIACQYCPIGHTIVQNLIDDNPGNVFAIKVHEGGYAEGLTPDFTTQWGTAIVGQSNNGGSYPSGTINRQYFSEASSNNGTSIALGWNNVNNNPFVTAAEQVLLQSAYVNVGVEANLNIETRELTVHVEAYYTGNSPEATNLLNVAVLQNNTIAPQSGEGGGDEYNHTHRLVDMITGQWGETIDDTSTGSFVDRNFSYTIPSSFNDIEAILEDIEVVAYISETTQDIINGNGVYPNLQLLPFDIGVSSINSPNNDSSSSNELVTITVSNFGESTVSNFDISYQLDSETIVTETFNNSLTSGQSDEFTFNTTLDLSNLDNCQLSVYTSLPEDENNSNDGVTQAYSFLSYCTPSAGSCNLDGIKQFILNTINVDDGGVGCNTEPVDGPLGYADRSNLITDLSRYSGQNNYTIQAMQLWGTGSDAYPPNSEGFAVWIDFNDNGSFEASELLIESSFDGYGVLEDFTLNIPTDASLGVHILRAKAIDLTTGDNLTNPCDDFSYGEVHDYSVNILATLGTNNINLKDNLKIFPNPSNGVFTIKTTLTNSSYKVHNLIGQTIKSGFINNGVNSIDIRNSIDGVYFITIESENGEKIGYKLIKN